MRIFENYDLTKLNTFGVSARAKLFVEVSSEEELKELFSLPIFKENSKLVLGGGSNILFTHDIDGLVILNKLIGIEILEEDEQSVRVRAMSGEVWHDLVLFAVGRGLWGIENLALIPGSVGGAPMQNIGAYGAELKNVLENVEAYNPETGEKRVFSEKECELGYRDSFFKNSLKDKYFIFAITLRLSKIEKKNLSYKILQDYLKNNPPVGGEIKSPKDIADAVVAIRQSKLPDPKVIGNAGSFFKNIFVDEEQLRELQSEFPEIPFFHDGDEIKIPSGWLVEQCGYKGRRVGNAGVHDRQALVIVNHGGATGSEIKALATEIIASVEQKFGLKLTPEVNLL